MDPIMMTALSSLVSALVGAVVSGVLTKARSVSAEQQALRDSMRSLLKAELFDLHHRYVEQGEPLDAMGLQLASQCYEVYHDKLGGNGLGTRLYQQIAAKDIH